MTGEELIELRKRLGWSGPHMAKRLGISHVTLHMVETGKRSRVPPHWLPKLQHFAKAADILDAA